MGSVFLFVYLTLDAVYMFLRSFIPNHNQDNILHHLGDSVEFADSHLGLSKFNDLDLV